MLRANRDNPALVSCALGSSENTLVNLNAAPLALVAASPQPVTGLRVQLLAPVLLFDDAGCSEACHLKAERRSIMQHNQAASYLEAKVARGWEQGSGPALLYAT